MPERVEFRAALSDPPLLLCVAYLNERKGHTHLIDAVRVLRDRGIAVHLQLAGDGETSRPARSPGGRGWPARTSIVSGDARS